MTYLKSLSAPFFYFFFVCLTLAVAWPTVDEPRIRGIFSQSLQAKPILLRNLHLTTSSTTTHSSTPLVSNLVKQTVSSGQNADLTIQKVETVSKNSTYGSMGSPRAPRSFTPLLFCPSGYPSTFYSHLRICKENERFEGLQDTTHANKIENLEQGPPTAASSGFEGGR